MYLRPAPSIQVAQIVFVLALLCFPRASVTSVKSNVADVLSHITGIAYHLSIHKFNVLAANPIAANLASLCGDIICRATRRTILFTGTRTSEVLKMFDRALGRFKQSAALFTQKHSIRDPNRAAPRRDQRNHNRDYNIQANRSACFAQRHTAHTRSCRCYTHA